MIRNYFKIAWRNLCKDKTFTFLNIVGLTAAFSVAILLGMYAFFGLSFNVFHENNDSLYQVYYTEQTPDGTEASESYSVPFAPALKEEVPGIEKITRYNGKGVLVINGEKELRMSAAYVDSQFFSMFSFPVIQGKAQDPLSDKSTVSITSHAAKRLFGDEDPINQTIRVMTEGEEKPFTIAAVLEDFPAQSSLKFDIALDFSTQGSSSYANIKDDWSSENHEVYLQLASEISPEGFEKSTRAFTDLHFQDDLNAAKRDGAQPDKNGFYKQIRLFPFKDISFARFDDGVAKADKTMPYLVLGIAFLVLFIACVNFINMSIAKSAQRLREIGMRKTLGANKKQLFFQFWGESVLVFLSAAMFGCGLSYLLVDSFQTLFETRASFDSILNFPVVLFSVLALLSITLIAGGYPAMLLTRLGTLKALKGKLNLSGKNKVRDYLMVIQFAIAILLISGTFVLWQQIEFMRNKNLGYNKEQVISIPLNGKRPSQQGVQLLRNELQDNSEILSISAADNILGLGRDGSRMTSIIGFEYKGRGVETHILTVDHDYPETLDLDILQGRSFDRDLASDTLALLINEQMAAQLQEENPLEARFVVGDSTVYQVVGVLEDYNFQELNKAVEPLTLFLQPNTPKYYAYVKVAPNQTLQSFEAIKKAWSIIEPNAQFLGSFLDENIDRTFKEEKRMATMITSGSILAILLSCIGLFAISLLVVSQRRKEIGVRKVVGASATRITVMLSVDFVKLVGIGFLIAAPFSWWLSKVWLQNYANHINLNIWVFLVAGLAALFIALITISIRTIRAALQNPVESLRTK